MPTFHLKHLRYKSSTSHPLRLSVCIAEMMRSVFLLKAAFFFCMVTPCRLYSVSSINPIRILGLA